MSNLGLLQRAADAAACQTLQAAGLSLVGAGAVAVVGAGVGFVPLTAGMATLLAANYLCPDQPLGGYPSVPSVDGCQVMEPGGFGQLQVHKGFGDWTSLQAGGEGSRCTEILSSYTFEEPQNRGYAAVVCFNSTAQQNYCWTVEWFGTKEAADAVRYRILPTNGVCMKDGDKPSPLPPDVYEPISYTDDITNCTYNVTFQGFAQLSPGGPADPVSYTHLTLPTICSV